VKLSDYIVQRLVDLGISRCFAVSGGAVMHLVDSFGKHPKMHCTFLHHEQSCAIAAEGYARITGQPAVVLVTAGPGILNALNGIFGAYTDSIPMLVISGQAKTQTMSTIHGPLELRQLGDQELRTEPFSYTVSKKYVSIKCADDLFQYLDTFVEYSQTGRPGPCWLEIPVDVQAQVFNPNNLNIELPKTTHQDVHSHPFSDLSECLSELNSYLLEAKRPLLMLGSGVRISNTQHEIQDFAISHCLPIVTAWTHDTIIHTHEMFVGRPGTIGTRPGNFAVQSCDLLIVLGSRLNIRQVSYNWDSFAKNASIVMVDIDQYELSKHYLAIDLKICADLRSFSASLDLLPRPSSELLLERKDWLSRLKYVKSHFDLKHSDYPKGKNCINPYHFLMSLDQCTLSGDNVVCGDATACIVPFQVLRIKHNMRLFSNSGCASMGYDLPAGIGAAIAAHERGLSSRTIVIAGDGSIMMNLQELQSLSTSKINIALFILDNGGYLSIRQTHENFFGQIYGATDSTGLTFPDFKKVVESFNICTHILYNDANLVDDINSFLSLSIPRVCIVKLDSRQEFEPRLKSRMSHGKIETPDLDDMYPHVPQAVLSSVRSYLKGTSDSFVQ